MRLIGDGSAPLTRFIEICTHQMACTTRAPPHQTIRPLAGNRNLLHSVLVATSAAGVFVVATPQSATDMQGLDIGPGREDCFCCAIPS